MQKELGSQFSQLWGRDGWRCAYWGTWSGFWTGRVLLHLHSFSSVAHRRMTMDMSSGHGQTGSKPTFLVWLNGLFSLKSTPLSLQKQTKNKNRSSVQSLALSSSSFIQFRVRKLGVTRVSPSDIKSRDVGETAMMMGGEEAGMEGGMGSACSRRAAQTGGALRCSRYWWMSSASRFSQAAFRRMFSQHCCTVRSAAGAGWLSKKLCKGNAQRPLLKRRQPDVYDRWSVMLG